MYARVGNRPDAEDLTAEVFRTALGPLRLASSKGEVRSYLLVTARTVLASHWRRQLGRPVTSIDPSADLALPAEPSRPDGASEAPYRTAPILAALPDRYRRVLELNRKLSAFIDAMVSGRRPPKFAASPHDAEALRMAIALRAARPDDAQADDQLVSNLYRELASQPVSRAGANVRLLKPRRTYLALGAVAASLVLVAGTATVTEAVNKPTATSSAVAVPRGQVMRTATFETADHRVVGQIVAYNSRQSWVFMDVDVTNYQGRIFCMLQAHNGSTLAAGAFDLHSGLGEFSKALQVNIGSLGGPSWFLRPARSSAPPLLLRAQAGRREGCNPATYY
jgi:hypothetical protein